MLATILENIELSRGNRWLKIHLPGEAPFIYEPGHVVGLLVKVGNQSFRHPYTISRADSPRRTLEFLYRVIPDGWMTPHLARLGPGAELQLTGKGGHPISSEVNTASAGLVLVSTGTGIGPIFGYCQMALQSGQSLPIKLFAGFREEVDICLQSELEQLAAAYSNFEYKICLSRPISNWPGLRGHVTENIPDFLSSIKDLHFHLVGNGNMVVELYKVLTLVGLKEERVTSEIYFNYPEVVDEVRLKQLAAKYSVV